MEGLGLTPEAWRGRRVVVTGHTGFKGAWLALWLQRLGAHVIGIALPPEHERGAFRAFGPWHGIEEHIVDVRDGAALQAAMAASRADVVFHLAAQALVRRGHADLVGTFATNVMGTAHLLDAVARVTHARAVVVVTSDKVYLRGDGIPHVEADPLGGDDPYSASKACAEMVATAWRRSAATCPIGTARAGNVLGGGDWGEDRLVPDILRAVEQGRAVAVRHPDAVRPWQFVLDPLAGYLMLAERLLEGDAPEDGAVNFGPSGDSPVTVAQIVELVLGQLGRGSWKLDTSPGPPETAALRLDAGLASRVLGWRPLVDVRGAVQATVGWHRAQWAGEDPRAVALRQIERYETCIRDGVAWAPP